MARKVHNACIAMHDGHHTVLNQDNGTSLVLINLENIVVPSLHQGFVSAELCAALLSAQ